MKKQDIKKAIDSIEPSAYMKTRLKAKISENEKKSRKSILKPVVSCALALAVLAGAGAYTISGVKPTATEQSSSETQIIDRSFSIVAYAKSNDGEIKQQKTLSNDLLVLPSYKISVENVNGDIQATYNNVLGFNIADNENIEQATFESQNGYFDFTNYDLYASETQNGNLYIFIELTEDEIAKYESALDNNDENTVKTVYNKIAEKRDLSKYFGNKSQKADLYSFSYGITKNKKVITLTNKSLKNQIFKIAKKIAVNTEDLSKEMNKNSLFYENEQAVNTLLKNPNTKFENLPSDIITITVKFKNGQSASKKIKSSFNSNGELQLEYVK